MGRRNRFFHCDTEFIVLEIARGGQSIAHYKAKWRNIWIRDAFLRSDPSTLVPGPNGPNRNTSRPNSDSVIKKCLTPFDS